MYCGRRRGRRGKEGIKMFLERVAMGARAIFPLASVSLARREKTEKSPLLPHIPIWMLPNWEEEGGKEKGTERYIRRIGA